MKVKAFFYVEQSLVEGDTKTTWGDEVCGVCGGHLDGREAWTQEYRTNWYLRHLACYLALLVTQQSHSIKES